MAKIGRIQRLKDWAANLKRDVIVLWLAARDPRVPLGAKIIAGAVAAYALSPIDLIPDFVPVLGLLDDLLIVPIGIWLAVRLIPPTVIDELRESAVRQQRPTSRAGMIIVLLLWLAACAAGLWISS